MYRFFSLAVGDQRTGPIAFYRDFLSFQNWLASGGIDVETSN